MDMSKLRTVTYILATMGMMVPLFSQGTSILTSVLCGLVAEVRLVIGILALALFLVGGVVYAIANFMPTTLEIKKSLMAWGMAMIVGGVVGLIIVIIASPLVGMITGLANVNGSPVSSINC